MPTLTLTNPTDRELLAPQVQGRDYLLAPGASMTTDDARLALLLHEYGFTMTTQDHQAAIVGDDHPLAQPVTGDEARFTGGRHHRSDDPRANVPGTPVEVTGDTGAMTNERAAVNGGDLPDVDTPGEPVADVESPAKAARRRRPRVVDPEGAEASVALGTDLTVKTTPQSLEAEDVVDAPSDLASAAASVTQPASPATRAAVDAAAGARLADDDDPDDADLTWIDNLRGARLDEELRAQQLDPTGKDAETKRNELRAVYSA